MLMLVNMNVARGYVALISRRIHKTWQRRGKGFFETHEPNSTLLTGGKVSVFLDKL